MSSIEDLLKKVAPATASVRVCLRGDLLGELDLLNDDLAQYDGWKSDSLSDVDPRADLLARKADLEAQMRAESATFTFHSIGDKPWSDLLALHPPREGKEDEEGMNLLTFPVALTAAASVDPKMSVPQVERLFDSFTLNQRNMIYNTAYAANVRIVDLPFLPPSSAKTPEPAKK